MSDSKNASFALSYAKDYAASTGASLEQLFEIADAMLGWLNSKDQPKVSYKDKINEILQRNGIKREADQRMVMMYAKARGDESAFISEVRRFESNNAE